LEKSSSAFRTISEVADELEVPKHVLRFWEGKFSQLRPMKRGGGRRYYRPEDVDLLRGIRWLLYSDGYTIKGVQRILRDNGVRFVKLCWQDDALDGGGKPVTMPEIPNLAEEAASEARRNPVTRRSKTEKGKPADAVEAEPVRFSGEQQVILSSLVKELEECRDVLRLAAGGASRR
jgi:DNA-binding transcriptional MerR regulator